MPTQKTTTEPLSITIFGGTGDLAQKKLYPALYHLFANDLLPDDFVIIGFARSELSDAEYQSMVHESLRDELGESEKETRSEFCSHLRYVRGNIKQLESYHDISAKISEESQRIGTELNKMIYLAVPPRFYSTIFEKLDDSKLGHETNGAFVRLLVEKPFGSDLETAQALDAQLADIFEERQIFRIDHYLAKTAVQNLIAFRFSNFLFEGSWGKESIRQVNIRMHEDFGVADRGAFYDSVGALRDVGQNHIMQMLALSTMGDPGTFDAQSIRDARAEVLQSLRIYDKEIQIQEHATRGQYEGYQDIDGVAEGSETETYFRICAFIDNDRWKGVPFILESGKKLHETRVEIEVTFEEVLPCVCGAEGPHGHENVLRLQMKPDQSIDVRFWARKPGMEYELGEHHMHFSYDASQKTRLPDAYEKILYDSIIGDQTLFTRSDEIQASWEFITPIVNHWDTTQLHKYAPGSNPASFEFLSDKQEDTS